MLLVTFASLQWYGSAAGAMIDTAPVIVPQLDIQGYSSPNISVEISNTTPYLKPTRLVNSPIEVTGLGVMQEATPKGEARGLLDVSIGATPSAFDIAQAVLNAVAVSYNIPNTIGAKINASGDGGGLTVEQDLKLDELHQLQGAKLGEAMTVDTLNGTRSVGSIVLDLDTPSDGVTIVTRQ